MNTRFISVKRTAAAATRLRELDDTNTRAFMDRAGTITWVRAGTISQLRCEQ